MTNRSSKTADCYCNMKSSFLATSEWRGLFNENISALYEDKSVAAPALLYHSCALPLFELFVEAMSLITQSPSTPAFASKRTSLLQRLVSQRISTIEVTRKLEQRDPNKATSALPSRTDTSHTHNDQVYHDRWSGTLLSIKTVVMCQARILVGLGVDGSIDMERSAEELACDISAAMAEHSKTAQWQVNAHIIVPCCNAMLSTTREWQALAAANDASEHSTIAPTEMWLKLRDLTGIASARPRANAGR